VWCASVCGGPERSRGGSCARSSGTCSRPSCTSIPAPSSGCQRCHHLARSSTARHFERRTEAKLVVLRQVAPRHSPTVEALLIATELDTITALDDLRSRPASAHSYRFTLPVAGVLRGGGASVCGARQHSNPVPPSPLRTVVGAQKHPPHLSRIAGPRGCARRKTRLVFLFITTEVKGRSGRWAEAPHVLARLRASPKHERGIEHAPRASSGGWSSEGERSESSLQRSHPRARARVGGQVKKAPVRQ
jgi:hypothetical protein